MTGKYPYPLLTKPLIISPSTINPWGKPLALYIIFPYPPVHFMGIDMGWPTEIDIVGSIFNLNSFAKANPKSKKIVRVNTLDYMNRYPGFDKIIVIILL